MEALLQDIDSVAEIMVLVMVLVVVGIVGVFLLVVGGIVFVGIVGCMLWLLAVIILALLPIFPLAAGVLIMAVGYPGLGWLVVFIGVGFGIWWYFGNTYKTVSGRLGLKLEENQGWGWKK
jgi:hypothetical protein